MAARQPQRRCRAQVEMGVLLPWHEGSGRYHVCLTSKQWATLFPRGAGKKLGCGAFACAWARGENGTVVKITRDRDDVANMIQAQGHARVLKVYEAYALEGAGTSLERKTKGRRVPVYAMVVERVKPFPPASKGILKKLPLKQMEEDYRKRKVPRAKFAVSNATRFKVDAACDAVTQKKPCQQLLHELVDTYEDLARQGIVWLDMHPGNLGTDREGRWKILDLGNSLVPVPRPRVTPLQGRRLRLRRVR